MRYLKQSTATTITIGPLTDETDGVTPITTVTVGDIAAAVIKGTARTALTLTASGGSNDFTHIGDGYWSLELTATDTGMLGALRVTLRDDDGFLPVWEDFAVSPANVYDSLVAGSDSLEVDATSISGSTPAANNVEANISNLDAAVSGRLAASAAPTNFGDLAITATTGKVTVSGTVDTNLTQIDGQATSGNNATLNLKQLNVVNSTGDAVVASSTGGDGVGINASGNGSGEGLKATGGATGHGVRVVGGATSGDGLRAEGNGGGDGIEASGGGANGHGMQIKGSVGGSGLVATGNGSGVGIQCAGGTSGHGLKAIGGNSGSQHGIAGLERWVLGTDFPAIWIRCSRLT